MEQQENLQDEFYDEKLRELFSLEPAISKELKTKMEMVFPTILHK